LIVDLERFIKEEEQYWTELESMLDVSERDPLRRMDLSEIKRFHYLYQRASAALVKVAGSSGETDIRRYLESLVARAYADIHELRGASRRLRPLHWFFETFPAVFRAHVGAFVLSLAITAFGFSVGAVVMAVDKEARNVIVPFSQLKTDPAKRVAAEEKAGATKDRLKGKKSSFSAFLMTHNTRVSLFTFALGFTWGIGTAIFLFYNGIVLGAVALDYVAAGQAPFLLGWLLPHGVIEIPAVLIAGQAGFILARAIIGSGKRISMGDRLRKIVPDMVTLLAGLAIMLVWAGVVEAFFSQYHEPVVPYAVKMAFGATELAGLLLFLGLSGRAKEGGRGNG
jgi:uncharacterized membrane protein SpoIIM required for sporulation